MMETTLENIKIERYAAYKDSGVEWLGEVPEHWECIRMKHLFRDFTEKNRPDAELLSVTQNKGVVPRTWVENRMVMPSGNLESFKFIEKGDFAISLRSFEGGLEYCYHDGLISPAYTVLKAKRKFDNQYYKYLFKSFSFISELQTSIVGIREGKNISYAELSYSFLPIPPFPEQSRIATFLDQKNAQIDQAIAQKEQLIALLKERRQILIHNAVTRGLDPNVRMKDSGVEWIGEVPEHWNVLFNRRLFREKSRKITNPDELPLSLSQVDGVLPSDDMKERSLSPSHRDNFKLCLKGDLVVNRFKGHLGVFFQSKLRGIITFHYGVFAPEKDVNSKYFELLFHTEAYKAIYAGASNGMSIGLQNLSNQNFYDVKSIVPPIEEQNMIIEYSTNIDSKVERVIACKQAEIEKLKEYKATLINSAVTGKIKI